MSGTPCIISDIDGTLADCEHRRHHLLGEAKDWSAFFAGILDDRPIVPIVNAYHLLIDGLDCHGVLLTGRNEAHRAMTEQWLDEWKISHHALRMRADGDFRPDDVVKGEMLDALLADGFEPYLVLDDRSSVVAMWRSRGLVCLQVAEGDF